MADIYIGIVSFEEPSLKFHFSTFSYCNGKHSYIYLNMVTIILMYDYKINLECINKSNHLKH